MRTVTTSTELMAHEKNVDLALRSARSLVGLEGRMASLAGILSVAMRFENEAYFLNPPPGWASI